MLDCPPVQSFHNTTAKFRVHASVTFLVNGGRRPLLMMYFLKRLETSPFHRRWFSRCAINRLNHAFHCTRNNYTNGALTDLFSWQLRGNFSETSSASCLSRMHRALPRINLHYFCLSCMRITSKSEFGKFQHKHFGYSQEKSKRQCLLLFFIDNRIQNF